MMHVKKGTILMNEKSFLSVEKKEVPQDAAYEAFSFRFLRAFTSKPYLSIVREYSKPFFICTS